MLCSEIVLLCESVLLYLCLFLKLPSIRETEKKMQGRLWLEEALSTQITDNFQ